MTEKTQPLDSFETALLAELRTVVATREPGRTPTPRRRTRRLAYAGLAAAAAAGIAVVSLPGPGAPPAYAFSESADGTVHVEVGGDATSDALEQAFAEHGIKADVTFLDLGMMCGDLRGTAGTMPSGPWSSSIGVSHDGFSLTIPAGYPVAGETLVLTTTRPSALPTDPDAPLAAPATSGLGFVSGDVTPCDPEPIPE